MQIDTKKKVLQYTHPPNLEKVILVGAPHLVVLVVIVVVPEDVVVYVHRLLLRDLIDLLRLLRLPLDLALGLLDLLVLDDVARLDDVGDGIVVEYVLALLDDLLQECRAEVDLSVTLVLFRPNIVSQVCRVGRSHGCFVCVCANKINKLPMII
jgi:hypothetical protein